MATRLIEIIDKLPPSRIALLGDFMVDVYIHGNAERLSPEAPVPVLHFQHEEHRLGGAGSVAANLATLHAAVLPIGITGNDSAAGRLREMLSAHNALLDGLVTVEGRPTTTKLRLVGSAQHRHPQTMLRVDYEDPAPCRTDVSDKLYSALESALDRSQVLCIEDYNKGVVTPELCQKAISLARSRDIPVFVDPANLSDYSKYRSATCIKLNRSEAQRASALPVQREEHFAPAADVILKKLDLECVVMTLDKDGAYLATRTGERRWLRTRQRQVYDVTGAGDMVLAMLAVARCAGATWTEAVTLANVAGGLEVERFGAVPIKPREILQELLTEIHEHLGKERSLEQLASELAHHRASGKSIVFTNGCFDIIHLGHVKYFQFAKHQGDILVVGVNTDTSIRRLKGSKRPLISEQDRVGVLEELESIDYLIRFDEDTPLALIERIQPDVLVKGADYAREQVVGWEIVERRGGRVALAPLVDGRSTTNVIQKILDAYGQP